MDALTEVMRYSNAALFSVLGIVCYQIWRRQRAEPAQRLALTFGSLGAVAAIGLILPEASKGEDLAVAVARRLLIVGLVLFPYLLYRFAVSFGQARGRFDRLARVVTVALVTATLVLPRIPTPKEVRPAWFQAWILAFLLYWAILSVVVARSLWRSGRGLPTVTRRRMRMLALGSLLLTLALLPAALAAKDQPFAIQLVTRMLPAMSALFFYLGFAPPAWLRTVWRRPEQQALLAAELEILTEQTREQVLHRLLPYASRVIGARGVAVLDDEGAVLARHGLDAQQAENLMALVVGRELSLGEPTSLSSDVLAFPVTGAVLAVVASPYTPFFGTEEISLLQELGIFTELVLQREKLLESERGSRQMAQKANTELETLAYGLSHDLKSPMISLLGYVDLIEAEYGDVITGDGAHYLARMTASARYMQDLIQDLLELSRIGRVQTEVEKLDLRILIEEVLSTLRDTYPAARVSVGELPTLLANPLRMRQLMTNLIENAMIHGGRPDIGVRVDAAPVPGNDGSWEISVIDDGIGIPAVYREKVFGIFERLGRDSRPGQASTGIGLAASRKIIEDLGGHIGIADTPTGTEFRITLPSSAVHAAAAERYEVMT